MATPNLTLADAILAVTTDQRQSFSCGPATAVGHVLNTLSLEQLNEDDATYEPYKMVLEAHVGDLAVQVALMLEISINEDDVWVSTDGAHATIDGMDPFEWLAAVGEDDE